MISRRGNIVRQRSCAERIHHGRNRVRPAVVIPFGSEGSAGTGAALIVVAICAPLPQDLTSDVVVALVNYFEPEMYSPAECLVVETRAVERHGVTV